MILVSMAIFVFLFTSVKAVANQGENHMKKGPLETVLNDEQREIMRKEMVMGEKGYKNETFGNNLFEITTEFQKTKTVPTDSDSITLIVCGLVYMYGQLPARFDERLIPILEKLPTEKTKEIESKILAIEKPTQQWFSSFDDEKHYKNLKRFTPRILDKIMRDYEMIKNDPSKTSNYLSPYGVKKLKELQTEKKI